MAPDAEVKSKRFPRVSTAYLHFLTDDFGMWQHTAGESIDRKHGYALDDSARALIAALRYGEDELAATYLEFVRHACADFPRPVNFFDQNRQPLNRPVSYDALGEVWWALGIASEYGFGTTSEHEETRNHILPYLNSTHYLRSLAYAVIPNDNPEWRERFVRIVKQGLERFSDKEWVWPEEALTYGSAIVPYALLSCGEEELGLQLLDFLNRTYIINGLAMPIGNEGPHIKGEKPPMFDQQPIEAAYFVLANTLAWRITGEGTYCDAARAFLGWFWGNNITGHPIISRDGQALHDSLRPNDVSPNRGAENIACYLIAQWEYFSDPPLPAPQIKSYITTRHLTLSDG